ncbi:MAG TPA: hypothetical protein VNT01_12565 [Symbiobacteriaceae bacterium]|nr:hypothetical protein [Symbiobacteriaceae bacterium]
MKSGALDRAKKTVAGQLARIRSDDFYPRRVVAEARGALSQVPTDGLPPELAKIRRDVSTGADGLEKAMVEAEAAYERAVRSVESLTAGDGIEEIEQVARSLNACPAVVQIGLAAACLDWWTAGLLKRFRAIRIREAPEGRSETA